LYLRDEIAELKALLLHLIDVICNKSGQHAADIMPGYTHLQRAQPVTLGHYLMAYGQMLARDVRRLDDVAKNMNVLPLGSCALAGTTYPIDRFMVAELLGFDSVCQNSMDGVSDRDYAIELLSALSILMMHLSRFSEEIILWSSSEFGFVDLDDAFSTGSSIMPQKKNPDIAELVRGKTGRVYGDLTTLLTVMKGIPLAYNKDMQEDKEAVFDAVDTAKICLELFAAMLDTATFKVAILREAVSKGFINATDCADYMVKKGLPFRSAYKIVGQLVAYCIAHKKTLETLSLDEYHIASPIFEEDVYKAIDPDICVAGRACYGGPAPERVLEQIEDMRKYLNL
jgi:argininosuccinate lyase